MLVYDYALGSRWVKYLEEAPELEICKEYKATKEDFFFLFKRRMQKTEGTLADKIVNKLAFHYFVLEVNGHYFAVDDLLALEEGLVNHKPYEEFSENFNYFVEGYNYFMEEYNFLRKCSLMNEFYFDDGFENKEVKMRVLDFLNSYEKKMNRKMDAALDRLNHKRKIYFKPLFFESILID